MFAASTGAATAALASLPEVALVIDDIGYNYANSRAAIDLPQAYAYAVLPFSPHAVKLATAANESGKDVILHLPMEANRDNHLLGSGALRLGMTQTDVEAALRKSLAAVPFVIGVNNHMGSRLTRETAHMRWLMEAIRQTGDLFFIDSRTTTGSHASFEAKRAHVSTVSRDIFLDNVRSQEHITRQLRLLISRAKKVGHALGIAHPHFNTIAVLRAWVPEKSGVRLLKISDYLSKYQYTKPRPGHDLSKSNLSVAESADQSSETTATQDPHAQR